MIESALRVYDSADSAGCLALFDANCPAFFAPVERDDYRRFLEAPPGEYWLCESADKIVGAFGLTHAGEGTRRLNWILLDPQRQGQGLGSELMGFVLQRLRGADADCLQIAASHKSAPFFARFGAREIKRTTDGWGQGMHRVDMELAP